MTVFAQIKSVIKTARFWFYVAILTTLAAGYRFVAPSEVQSAICSWYQDTGKPKLRDWLKSQGTGPTSNADSLRSLIDTLPDRLDGLVCVAANTSPDAPDPSIGSFLVTSVPAVVLLVLILAMVVPGLIPPPRPSAPTVSVPQVEYQRVTRTAALQAGALRVAILYALASCLATVLFPPEDARSFFASDNTKHLIGLVVGTTVAIGIALRRMPIDLPPKEVALHVATGGVVVAGLIFMVIVMPYRMRAVDGGLTPEQVQLIALVRIVVLPLVSYGSAWAYFGCARALRRSSNGR